MTNAVNARKRRTTLLQGGAPSHLRRISVLIGCAVASQIALRIGYLLGSGGRSLAGWISLFQPAAETIGYVSAEMAFPLRPVPENSYW
ncbi:MULTISPECIES: hypothetical protein [Ralstonia]|uniref:hypothetical protein n=1 Tax=Ralstonia TaxID=48736 RepID=UPI001268EB40|nr:MULTISPECIES: hypothetical protein [Ralstonia]MBY4707282.1 hypothetical protein [Ralstonia insidiosa]